MTSDDEEEDSLLQPNAFTIITQPLSLDFLLSQHFMSSILKGGKKKKELPLHCFFFFFQKCLTGRPPGSDHLEA